MRRYCDLIDESTEVEKTDKNENESLETSSRGATWLC